MTLTHRHLPVGKARQGEIETVCGLHITADELGGLPASHDETLARIEAYKALPLCPGCQLIQRAANVE